MNGQWGAAIALAPRRLQSMLKQKHDAAIQRRKNNTQDFAGACKWIKKNEPVPWIIRDAQDQATGNRAHAVTELKQHWSEIFGQHRLDKSPFWALYETDPPPVRQPPRLGPINCAQLLSGARKLQKRADGLDGLNGRMLLLLPQPALIRAAQMINAFKRRGQWPQNLLHWKITFIPKKRKSNVPDLSEVRPIAIGPSPILYRLWASHRLQQLGPLISGYLEQNQAGGTSGPDVTSILLDLDLENGPETHPFGMCLDYIPKGL